MAITVGVITSSAPIAITATIGMIAVIAVIAVIMAIVATDTGAAKAHCALAAPPCAHTNGPEGPFCMGCVA